MIKKLLLVLTLYSSVNIGGAIDFNKEPPGRLPGWSAAPIDGPVVIEGFTFTPSEWNMWVIPDTSEQDDKPWMYTSPWLGFDDAMTVTNGGKFNFMGFDSTGRWSLPGRVMSSNGHVFEYQTFRDMATRYDLNWRDISWIRFDVFRTDLDTGAPMGFDNLEVNHSPDSFNQVPEPATLILFLVVLPFAPWMRSRGYR